jgi:hypothetical protein
MTNIIKNQEKDEIQQGRVWQSLTIIGEWEGTGRWNEDKQWKGLGTWQGGLLSGTWDGKGKWEPIGDGKGTWKGNGDLISNMSFRKYAKLIFVMKGLVAFATIGLVSVVAGGFISNWSVIGGGAVSISLLFLVSIIMGRRETAKGGWWGDGTWEDVGDFRILDISGTCRLGYHTGIIRGKMKDLKPR